MADAFNLHTDFMRMMADFRMPEMMNLEALAAAQRRNIEALSAANRMALEGAQAVAKRHMEIMQQSMTEMTDAMRGMASAEAPQDKTAKQAELAKSTYQRAVSNMQELGELIQKSNAEALSVLNNRFTEAMEEIKGMAKK